MKRSKEFMVAIFVRGGKSYAIRLDCVEGVVPVGRITSVPGNASRFFVGLLYALGHVMPIVDVAPLFNTPTSGHAESAVVVSVRGMLVAFMSEQDASILAKPKVELLKPARIGAVTQIVRDTERIPILLPDTLIDEYLVWR